MDFKLIACAVSTQRGGLGKGHPEAWGRRYPGQEVTLWVEETFQQMLPQVS